MFFGIFEIGSLICGVANSSAMLIGGRAIAGCGASGMMNGGMTIIAGAVPLQKRPRMLHLTSVQKYRGMMLI
jgi:MFS family permease